MQHIKCRCKHCQKTYYYCTYGNGPDYGTEAGCSMDYCGKCQTAINNSLSKIPVKFTSRFKEIKPSFGIDKVLNKIKEEKTRDIVEHENREALIDLILPVVYSYVFSEYDNVETYTHYGKTFRVEWNDGEEDKKHYFLEMEWDMLEKKFTGKAWGTETYDDTYKRHKSIKPFSSGFKPSEIKAASMSQPMGKLFYMEPLADWDLDTPHSEPKPKEHTLRTWNSTYTGFQIKCLLSSGRANEEVVLGEGISIEDIEDALNYNTEHQRYEDEDIETITKIEFV